MLFLFSKGGQLHYTIRHYKILHNLANYLYRNKLYKLSKLVWLFERIIFAYDIPSNLSVKNISLPHAGLGVVIHKDSILGENIKIFQNVTIGGNGSKVNNGAPNIGDNVILYANSVVLGRIHIGENSIIGANTVITKDIPPNVIVYGNPNIVKKRQW